MAIIQVDPPPHPVTVTIRNNGGCIKVAYCYYTTITGWGCPLKVKSPLKEIEYGVNGDLIIMYPKPYSIYFRGTVFVFVGKGLKRKIAQPSCEAGAGTSSSS